MDFTQFLSTKRYNKLKNVIEKRRTDLTIVLENIIDPHNISACLRSCDATGIMTVRLVYDGSQPFPKLSKTSSASANKWVETIKYDTIESCYKDLRAENFYIFTTALTNESVSLYEVDLTKKIALVFGNEHTGVSEKATQLADANYLIPQIGMIQSLNISVACAVSLYEAFRQRNQAKMFENPQLDSNQIYDKLNHWAQR